MKNPFEFDAAPNIEPRQMVQWFISQHNYSRFVGSSKNVIINGERGSGKSMMLMYYSLTYQKIREDVSGAKRSEDNNTIGIYVPCVTPLHRKQDYLLLREDLQEYYSEQVFVLSIAARIAKEFIDSSVQISPAEGEAMVSEFESIFSAKANDGETAFHFLRRVCREKLRNVQVIVGGSHQLPDNYLFDTFYDVILPILEEVRNLKSNGQRHISLMFDDVQNLNSTQKRLLNSWIGYRDNSLFSIKAAIAGVRQHDFSTNHGSALLEGHDYIVLDLQKPFQSRDSDFEKFLNQVIKKRLAGSGIKADPSDFFRVSPQFVKDLQNAKSTAEIQATDRGYKKGTKQFTDFVYKKNRAIYFAKRAQDKANKPPYSGLDTLQHLSTGVIRNFLQPAFYMFEKQVDESPSKVPSFITPEIQRSVILEQSDNLWKLLSEGLSKKVANCTLEDQQRLNRLYEKLGEHFRDRLLSDISEPRVLVFVVSDRNHPHWADLQRLFNIAEAAQLLYTRVGTSKAGGGRETYYVPNRMLWPRYGLDVHGQHGRASLKVGDLWAAACENTRIPLVSEEKTSGDHSTEIQGFLFDE